MPDRYQQIRDTEDLGLVDDDRTEDLRPKIVVGQMPAHVLDSIIDCVIGIERAQKNDPAPVAAGDEVDVQPIPHKEN